MDLKWAWVTFSSRKGGQLPPWWEVGLKTEWQEPELCVSQSSSYAQWLSMPYQGHGQVPRCWSRSPKDKIKLIPPPLGVTLPSSQHQHPHPRGNSTGARRGQVGTQVRPLHMLGDGPSTPANPDHFWFVASTRPSNGHPHPLGIHARFKQAPSSLSHAFSSVVAAFTLVKSYTHLEVLENAWRVPGHTLGGWVGGVRAKQLEPWSFNLLPSPYFEST